MRARRGSSGASPLGKKPQQKDVGGRLGFGGNGYGTGDAVGTGKGGKNKTAHQAHVDLQGSFLFVNMQGPDCPC
jgi:hypothetical protein